MLGLAAFCAAAPGGEIFAPRQLALSPDGSRLAFVYMGDIWVASSTGGRAIPITSHIEMDDAPVWSPDGQTIAFSSNRYGSRDIFVAPADGGPSKRITFSSAQETPSDWTPDGKAIIYSTTYDKAVNGLYSVDVESGQIREWLLDFATLGNPKFSIDGKSVYYNRFGFPWYRARYQGSAASQLWSLSVDGGQRNRIQDNGFQHLWAGVTGSNRVLDISVGEKTPSSHNVNDKPVKFVDSPARTPNVYDVTTPGKIKRLTDFVSDPVRFLATARKSDTYAFVQGGHVFVSKGGAKPSQIELNASLDDKMTQTERQILTGGASEAELTASGENMVFVVQGEIWSVPTKKGKGPNANDATQITKYAGRDYSILRAKEGNRIYFLSDESGSDQLYAAEIGTGKITQITNSGADVLAVERVPGGTSISYWQSGNNGGLMVVDGKGGAPKKVLDYPGEFSYSMPQQYAWSPDGRYVAYRRTIKGVGNIWIYDTQTKQDVNVTKLNANHYSPMFSADGRFLYFSSDRDGQGMYVVPLKQEDARLVDSELTYTKPTAPVAVTVDFEDIENRIRMFWPGARSVSMWMDPTNGDIWNSNGGELAKVGYDGQNARVIGSIQGGFSVSGDENKLVFVRDGQPQALDIRKQNLPVETSTFRADWVRDLRREHRAAFIEIWRAYNRSFYDSNFHGRDWNALRDRYLPYVDHVGHRNEMAIVLNMMVGELESSHSEVGPAGGNPRAENTATLGFTIDYSYSGPGVKVLSVPKYAPGSFAKTKLNPGDIVLTVNGQEVRANQELFQMLNEQAGRDVTLTVNTKPEATGARTVKFRALSGGEMSGIFYRDKIEDRRQMVEKLSGGKVAYVHIAGMGGGNFERFNREIWQLVQGKKAVIIDVRENGGGNISDRLIDIIERIPHSYYVDRDGVPEMAPDQSWAMPTVVMHAESSYSNAEMFPYAMHQRRLATTVGRPTPGYVIWTYELGLVDGTSARMPTAGVYRLDGTPLENMGQVPDYDVTNKAEDVLAGRDAQLEKAVEVLLKQIK